MRTAIDSHVRGLVVVDSLEYSVHRGHRFKISYLVEHGSELGNDAVLNVLVKVGSKHVHAVPRLAAGGDCDLLMYTGTTTSNDGTPIGVVAKNQADERSSNVTAFSAPTITADGSLLWSQFVPGGSGPQAAGGDWSEAQWILKCNTYYLFRMTNRSGGVIQLSFSIGWMEE